MKLVTIYKTPLNLQHKHHLFSLASTLVVVLNALVCILPLLLCWNGQFLDVEFSLYEQPRVLFNFQYLFTATIAHSNDTESVVTCSSFDRYNQLTDEFQQCSSLKYSHQDLNHDGIDDVMDFDIAFERPEQVTSFSLYLELDASLQKFCDFTIPAAVLLHLAAPPPFSAIGHQKLRLSGDLNLEQFQALHCPYFMVDQKSHFQRKLINRNSSRLADYELPPAYAKLVTNPASYHFHETFRTSRIDGPTDEFTLHLELNLRETSVRYRKTFWRLAFEFWIHYLAAFVVLYTLADYCKRFLFGNNFFLTWKQVEGK